MKVACVNCSVPFDPDHLFDGHCAECLMTDGPVLPDDDHAFLEQHAVAACREGGLRAIAHPCGFEKCPSCKEKQKAKEREASTRVRYRRVRTGPEFTAQDGLDLERYFRMSLPSPAWDRSTFGEMCQRIGEETNPHTSEKPSPTDPRCPICGAPLTPSHQSLSAGGKNRHHTEEQLQPVRVYETEVDGHLVQVQVMPAAIAPDVWPSQIVRPRAGSGGGATYDEGDIASYFDGRYRMRDVYRVLARVPRWVHDVLEAKYGQSQERAASHGKLGPIAGVALFTDTLKHVKDNRARKGELEWITLKDDKGAATKVNGAPSARGTLDELIKFSTDSTVTAQIRSSANGALERIRRDAEQLLRDAEREYAACAKRVVV